MSSHDLNQRLRSVQLVQRKEYALGAALAAAHQLSDRGRKEVAGLLELVRSFQRLVAEANDPWMSAHYGRQAELLEKQLVAAVEPRQPSLSAEGPRPELRAVRGWPDVVGDLGVRLADLWSADIRVVNAAARIQVDRILDAAPFCVAWTEAATATEAHNLAKAGWSLWRPDYPVEVARWRDAVTPPDVSHCGYLIATLRNADPYQLARQLASCLESMGLDPSETHVRSDECSPAEHARRTREADAVERRAHRQTSGDGRPILGYCKVCGHPLTDPVSARLGYGPFCKPRGATTKAVRRDPAIVASSVFHVAGTPVRTWRDGFLTTVAARRAQARPL